jgi:putative peptidoglycan lipid II flippase
MKLLKAMATVGGLTGVSRILGFIRDVMTAAILGAGPVADAFIVALKLPNFFRRITAEGAFSVSFVPMYSKKRTQEGDGAADAFASNTFGVMCMVLTPFVLVCMAFMPHIIQLIAPGFEPGTPRYDLSVEMTRVTFPYLLLISLSALLGGVLNAHDKFMPFAATPIVFNLTLIGALVFLEPHLATGGHALSWGLFIAGFLQVIGLMYFIRKTKIDIKFKLPKFDADTKQLFKLMGPGVLGAGVMHVNLFVDVIIASTLAEGSISYLYYADRLNQLPLGMVGIAVGTALLPMLSRAFAGEDTTQAKYLYNRAMEVCLLLALPAGVAMMVTAEPLIKSLFQYGAFDAQDAHTTAMVLTGYAIGVAPYVAGKVLSTAYYARQDTQTPVKMAVICALANIGLALVLIRSYGVAGIAFSTGVCGWVQCYLLWRNLKGVEAAQFDDRFKRSFPRIIISCCAMAAVLFIVGTYTGEYFDGNKFEKISALCVLVASGLATYSLAVFTTGALKISEIKTMFTRKKAS